LQTFVPAQSLSPVHAARQAVPLQVYGAHDCIVAARHVPAPSHVRGSVAVAVPAGQTGGAHCVPAS
jgi:hypothetical protein